MRRCLLLLIALAGCHQPEPVTPKTLELKLAGCKLLCPAETRAGLWQFSDIRWQCACLAKD